MFGQQVQFYRRKPNVDCYIEEAFINPPQLVKTCECSRADFECESGFIVTDSSNSTGSKACVPLAGYEATWGSCSSGSSALLAAYRKIPRSKCVNGLRMDTPEYKGCFGDYSAGAWIAMIFLPIAVVAGVTAGLLRSRKHRVMVGGFLGRLKDRFRGVRYARLTTDDADTLMDDYA